MDLVVEVPMLAFKAEVAVKNSAETKQLPVRKLHIYRIVYVH